jgi:hypothetical protein
MTTTTQSDLEVRAKLGSVYIRKLESNLKIVGIVTEVLPPPFIRGMETCVSTNGQDVILNISFKTTRDVKDVVFVEVQHGD